MPPTNVTETMSPWACANSFAKATPSSERSAGHGVKPIKNERVAGPRYSPNGAAEGWGAVEGPEAGAGPPGGTKASPTQPATINANASNVNRKANLMLVIIGFSGKAVKLKYS